MDRIKFLILCVFSGPPNQVIGEKSPKKIGKTVRKSLISKFVPTSTQTGTLSAGGFYNKDYICYQERMSRFERIFLKIHNNKCVSIYLVRNSHLNFCFSNFIPNFFVMIIPQVGLKIIWSIVWVSGFIIKTWPLLFPPAIEYTPRYRKKKARSGSNPSSTYPRYSPFPSPHHESKIAF